MQRKLTHYFAKNTLERDYFDFRIGTVFRTKCSKIFTSFFVIISSLFIYLIIKEETYLHIINNYSDYTESNYNMKLFLLKLK